MTDRSDSLPPLDRELLELTFDHVANGIYLVDGRGVTIRVNRAFEEMSGFSNAELVGRNLYDMVGPGKEFSGSASLLALEKRRPVTATYSTSTNRKLLVKGVPVFDDAGRIRYVINTIWDLTVVSYTRRVDADTARASLQDENDLVTCSPAMRQVLDVALRVAPSDSTLLLSGESGVGKSLLARLIHRASERRDKPFVHLNCGAIPETLIESELFGYEPGSFTGADRRGRPGLIAEAEGGTLFLDEISELPLHTQSKLLGVLQERTYFRIGGRSPQKADIRIIAASNRPLDRLVREGRFREDLFYRINVVPLTLPPLRQRREDIPLLAQAFIDRFNRKYGTYRQFSPELMARLEEQDWPGNIRELENLVERLIVTSQENVVTPEQAGLPQKRDIRRGNLKEQLAAVEADILTEAWRQHRTTRKIARALGVSQATIARKLQRYGIGLPPTE
ncbi:PAS domain S-box-containing protein/TyrR family helix-turn-helix protein [Geothermobacter ehrlichii]|uniref:HTH-type transcriptional regulatory protein TyrR n=1 Tax=Geothermobacter ehrlichii TaxID=213224 RepID=A0A5D3WJV4_9BACT|nr:sigma 54-interacting transcriptional regulator [Geothermobacter ehrlichii]TYO98587.1 PAS domain S-box-containing protein/TyrR family helix-turn-helix protein [Geothermobacter ehrlichii]